MAKSVKKVLERMEEEIMGGGKEEKTQPYKRYEEWLSEIEGYIQEVVNEKKEKSMKRMNGKDYEITEERNYPRNKSKSILEKKTKEERVASIVSKQNSSSIKNRGKGEYLI